MSEAEQLQAAAPEAAAAAAAILDALNATDSNGTEALNATAKFVATPEGTALAYGSLVLMALLPIFFGAIRSVSCSKSKELGGNDNGSGFRNASEMPETITGRDAARFPIIASCTLFGLYLFFKVFSQDYINLLLSVYFFGLGVLGLSHTMSPLMSRVYPASFPNKQYQLLLTQGSGESKEEIINYEFDTKNLVCLLISTVVGVWYLMKKVFGTNVMVTVAKSFEAPIKLVFPQDLLEKGLGASNFAMLGLGDIVIPGIFIALLLRFDVSLKRNSRTYFYSSFLAYIFGLGLTIFIMHTFKHAQPALLYLVPACVGFPCVVALIKGELADMFRYEEVPAEEESAEEDSSESEKKDQ
ncbi:minor histocompatibility antigen H13 isoform X3 [Brachionichthys hirsutus]|uniref:minor histocompatibility antigen H13 isoform X3 n=1 Tax=Brachionichthys hirsutus TaxID=412623 RepID=UPI0036051ECA